MQLFSLELDTTYLRIVDLDEVIVTDKHSLDDDIPGYQHEPDKYTTLGSMTILSLFIDSLANVKLVCRAIYLLFYFTSWDTFITKVILVIG